MTSSIPSNKAPSNKVSWSTTLAFGAPAVGAGCMYLLLSLYVMKFSTDVLLIAPGVMGAIYSLSRIWDAISDPLVGYFSDRTSSRLGRRRTWILASCLPISLGFYMVFAPPMSTILPLRLSNVPQRISIEDLPVCCRRETWGRTSKRRRVTSARQRKGRRE